MAATYISIRICLVLVILRTLANADGPEPEVVYQRDGDVVIGGLFGLHYSTKNSKACLIIREFQSLKRVEGFVYAIEYINNDSSILPGITIGFHIYDTCYYDIVALGRSMNFVPDRNGVICNCVNGTYSVVTGTSSSGGSCSGSTRHSTVQGDGSGGMCCRGTPLIGIVGAERSESSMQAATLLGLQATPQISYLSTSDSLSDKQVYPYFLRTVPPDRYQVSVIVDILTNFNWTYVSFLYSDDEYGQNAYSEFLVQTAEAGICIAYHQSLDETADPVEYDRILAKMMAYPYNKARAVVLFTHPQSAVKILNSSVNGSAPGHFTWIASDGVGNIGADAFDIAGLKSATLGMMATVPYSRSLPAFDDTFSQINPETSDDPWVDEFFRRYVDCPLDDNEATQFQCQGRWLNSRLPSFETLVMDAVFAYAYALDAMMNEECMEETDVTACVIRLGTDGKHFAPYLFATAFESLANGNFSFNQYGDGEGRYAIENYRLGADGVVLEAERVGFWKDGPTRDARLELHEWDVWFYTDVGWNTTTPPKSICSEECESRQVKDRIPDTATCCWNCRQCKLNEISATESECVACPADALPDPSTDYTTCMTVEPVPLVFHSWLGPFLVGLSGLGLLTALIIFLLYVYNINDTLLRGSDPVLHLLTLFGTVTGFTVGLMAVLPPSRIICTFTRIAGSVTYTIIYVPLAIKCVRLYRIFKKAKATDSQEDAHLLSLCGQFSLFVLAVLIQLAIETTWLLLYPSKVVPVSFERNGELKIQMWCDVFWPEPLSTIIYNFPFLIICCIFTILGRHLPDNYHEARFIAFSSFGSCILIGAFSVPYVTANLEFESSMYSGILTSLNAILVLVCLFVIKLYAVICITPEVPKLVGSALAPGALGIYKDRARTRTTSSSAESHVSTTNLVRRPRTKSSEPKEVTFSDIRPTIGDRNEETENTRL
ncbi:metabotropic glutamate receptor 3-like [Lytechinus pictus]|uniref:metabotropic glutamate receptor 3-like n=1 Tax=Lytechinus pictus TaxID=7653 RepID=UPI0030BA285F